VRGSAVDDRDKSQIDALDVGKHVVVPKANHGKALAAKPRIARPVCKRVRMLAAIDLDDDPSLE
jgi:hypothetical protein